MLDDRNLHATTRAAREKSANTRLDALKKPAIVQGANLDQRRAVNSGFGFVKSRYALTKNIPWCS